MHALQLAALKGNRSVPISGESIGVKENEQTHAEMEEEMENPRADESDEPESASSVDTSRTVADVVAVATAALEAAASASSEDDDKNCFEGDMGNVVCSACWIIYSLQCRVGFSMVIPKTNPPDLNYALNYFQSLPQSLGPLFDADMYVALRLCY